MKKTQTMLGLAAALIAILITVGLPAVALAADDSIVVGASASVGTIPTNTIPPVVNAPETVVNSVVNAPETEPMAHIETLKDKNPTPPSSGGTRGGGDKKTDTTPPLSKDNGTRTELPKTGGYPEIYVLLGLSMVVLGTVGALTYEVESPA